MHKILLAISISSAVIGISFYTGYKAGNNSAQIAVASIVQRSIESNAGIASLHNNTLAVIKDDFIASIKHVEKTTEDIIAAINSDSIRLSVNTICPPTTTTTGPSSSRNNGVSRGQLSKQDAKFFTELAGEADIVAIKLQACQKGYKSLWEQYEAMRKAGH